MTDHAQQSPDDARAWWRRQLGADRDPDGTWQVRPRPENARGWRDSDVLLHSYGSELPARLLRPIAPNPALAGAVVIIPFYDVASLVGEPSPRTAHRTSRTSQAYAVALAERGLGVLAVPWWFELAAQGSNARGLSERYGPPAAQHAATQSRTALGRSIGDLFLATDAVLAQDWVDPTKIGVLGHSLGGKLALHLAALDERVSAAVAHEPGLGLQHSNWDAPWYLGADRHFARDHDELLGLVAPRRILLGAGGDSDGDHNLDLVHKAASRWVGDAGPEVLRHGHGHPLTEDVLAQLITWLSETLARPADPRSPVPPTA